MIKVRCPAPHALGTIVIMLVLLTLCAENWKVSPAAAQPGSATTTQAQPAPAGVTVASVKAALPALEAFTQEALRRTGVPGVAIAVVHQDQVVYLKGFGVRRAGGSDAVSEDTVFQIASLSKPVASTVVAALVSDGVVTWDGRVRDYDSEFQMHDGWVTSEVTVRDFFAHRSGLSGNAGNDLEQLGYDRAQALRRLRYLRPASSFRSTYAYSNFGLTEGGVAAARAAGLSWEQASADRLYKPLRMTSTSSRYADFAARPNRAALHVPVNGTWTAKVTRNADAQSPAGGVSSTARDLAQWARLQLSNGKLGGTQIIKEDALAQTHLPLIMRGTNPMTGRPSFYGLGWGVDFDGQGTVHWSHAGAFSAGARTLADLIPSERLGIVVLANAFPTGLPEAIAATFFDLVRTGRRQQDWLEKWNKLYDGLIVGWKAAAAPYARAPIQRVPALPSAAYVGTYANDYLGTASIVEQDGGLTLRLGPQKAPFPLKHWDRDVFLWYPAPELPDIPSTVTFTMGPERRAIQVVLSESNDVGQGVLTRVP